MKRILAWTTDEYLELVEKRGKRIIRLGTLHLEAHVHVHVYAYKYSFN